MKNKLTAIDFLKIPIDNSVTISELKNFWKRVYKLISSREKLFDYIWRNGTDEEFFAELAFCLLTPQSKAILCWSTVNTIVEKNMLLKSTAEDLAKVMNKIRFKNNKAKYIVEARKFFLINNKIKIKKKLKSFKNIYELRKWLKKTIKGMGYKESGHFLRNIGIGKDLAILDRHVLKNLKTYDVIKEVPRTLNEKLYLRIEKQMQDFAKNISIPMFHLDMLFWCKSTGGFFK
jgi:N-glycosylase/DNA lyase